MLMCAGTRSSAPCAHTRPLQLSMEELRKLQQQAVALRVEMPEQSSLALALDRVEVWQVGGVEESWEESREEPARGRVVWNGQGWAGRWPAGSGSAQHGWLGWVWVGQVDTAARLAAPSMGGLLAPATAADCAWAWESPLDEAGTCVRRSPPSFAPPPHSPAAQSRVRALTEMQAPLEELRELLEEAEGLPVAMPEVDRIQVGKLGRDLGRGAGGGAERLAGQPAGKREAEALAARLARSPRSMSYVAQRAGKRASSASSPCRR